MDERTSSKGVAGHRKEKAGEPKGHTSGTPINPRLGAAFAASTSATASLNTAEVKGVMSKPIGSSKTPSSATSRHGRSSSSNAPSSGSSGQPGGDYFSQPSSIGQPSTSPSALRRAAKSSTGEQSTWSGHGRHASRDLPAIREYPSSQRGSPSNRPSMSPSAHEVQSEYPVYPNQSFTALSAQIHPLPHRSSYLRVHDGFIPTRSTTPHPKNPLVESRLADIAKRNTPVSTPGLYTPKPKSPASSAGFVSATGGGQQPTPSYLHPVQSIPPKMTTAVRKDVDVMSGRKILNEYELLEELGRGVHGKVKLARHLGTGQLVAIKIVARFSKRRRLGKGSSPEDKVKREVAILKQAQHPNVVKMIEVIDDPEASKIYIVLEYCEKKEINWRTPGIPEIVILENRRMELEREGITDFDAVTYNDPTIQTATRRLQVQQRMRPQRPQQTRSKSSYWSLEHGGSSEEEDEGENEDEYDVTPVEITPTTTHEQRPTEYALQSRASAEELAPHETAPATSYGESLRESTKSPTELAEGEFGNFTSLSFGASWQPQQRQISSSYGSSVGARRSSKAESIASQVTDALDQEVPDEELRFVPTMSIPEIVSAFRDALIGIEYLHYQGIIHRDIKPANLLRTSTSQVKISDFGVSYLGKPIREGAESAEASGNESQDPESEAELAKTVGTPAFYAPELCNLDFEEEMPRVTAQVDIWALGVTLYCMLFARTPFLADDQYALMRKIATEDVVIPQRRLKATEPRLDSPKSPSLGPLYQSRDPEKRLPDYWEHEYIDDELRDLLVRLFTKDPRSRITLKEIKHHPWVLRGIDHPSQWIQETDPAYKAPAKIEVDEEALAKSIVPVTVLGRIKSITSRAGRALGIGPKSSGERSSGHSEVGSSSSLHAAAEALNRDPRRQSLRLGDAITDALRASRDREHEHPLSRSSAPSPEPGSHQSSSRTSSRKSSVVPTPAPVDTLAIPRPSMPARDSSSASTADSLSTIRAGSYGSHVTPTVGGIQEDDFDGTEQTSTMEYSGPALASVFGGAGSGKLFRRPISRQPSIQGASNSHATSKLTSPESTSSPETPYGEPTVALASAFAAGQVQLPADLIEPGSITSSASSSRKSSAAAMMSRKSSSASQSGRRRGLSAASVSAFSQSPVLSSPGWHGGGQVDFGGGLSAGMANYHLKDEAATDDEYNHAMEAINRRRLLEAEQAREQHNASRNAAKAAKALNAQAFEADCPTSPDDDALAMPPPPRPNQKRSSTPSDFFTEAHSMTASPIAPISSTSSDDHFKFSQTSSHPSIPSVSSYATQNPADSEVVHTPSTEKAALTESTGSDESVRTVSESRRPALAASALSPPATDRISLPSRSVSYNDQGYAVDDGEDDEDSDEDEEFLMMGKKQRSSRSGSISNAQLSRRGERSESMKMVRKNTRSGSTSTMKKIRSHSSSSGTGSDRRL